VESVVSGRELLLSLPAPRSGERLVLVLGNGSQTSLSDYTLKLNPVVLPTATATQTAEPTATEVPPEEPTATPTPPDEPPSGMSVFLPWAAAR
jgi:hypothetical protein